MIGFWLGSALLMVVAAGFVLIPLWQQRTAASPVDVRLRRQANLVIYEERARELAADLVAGNIDQAQHDALLVESKRSLLTDLESAAAVTQHPGSRPGIRLLPIGLLTVMLVLAYPMYGLWGHLNEVAPADLYAATFDNVENDPTVATDLAIALGAVVQSDPENPWAWYFLARNFATLGRLNEAEIGFAQAVSHLPDGPDKAAVLGQHAQIRYVNQGGELNAAVMELVNQARAINPSEIAVLQLLSVDAEMNQDWEKAIDYWRLLIQANPNSMDAQRLRESIAAAQDLLVQAAGRDAGAGAPAIEVLVALAAGLELPADLRVFIAARNAQQEGMPPLAAVDLRVSDLPTTVTLDRSRAVTPMFTLAAAESVYVTATVSRTGSAEVQSGDYRVVSAPLTLAGDTLSVDLVIAEPVP